MELPHFDGSHAKDVKAEFLLLPTDAEVEFWFTPEAWPDLADATPPVADVKPKKKGKPKKLG